MFGDRTSASIYRGVKDTSAQDDVMNDQQKTDIERVLRRKPHRGFDGAESKGRPRDAPIQFEKGDKSMVDGGRQGGEDIFGFGMDQFTKPQKKLKK